MKIPKSLNIFGDVYKIIIEPDYFINDEDPDKWLSGDIDLNEKIIRVKQADESVMLKTLIHECIHAICHELELYSGEHDETFINRLSLGMVDMMLRNKLFKE